MSTGTDRPEGMVDLEGRVIVITGAAGGFGAAYARHLADLGACLVLNDLDAERLDDTAAQVRQRGRPVVTVAGSVSDWALADRLATLAIERFGRLDGLVNAAGMWTASEPWTESKSDLQSLIEVNLIGTVACGASASRAMKHFGRGAIVNLSSTAAFGLPRLAAYSATKAAVLAVTRSWALDLAPFGITVNAVAPSGLTAMSVRYRDLLRELGTPSAAAPPPPVDATVGIVGFLSSDAATRITGQMFWVTEGELATIELGGRQMVAAEVDASDADLVAAAFASGALGAFP